MSAAEDNQVRLRGILTEVRSRWTSDGSPSAIAALIISRPAMGPARTTVETSQPMPLRATGREAKALAEHEGHAVAIKGRLRRRYYSRKAEPCWGQVEVWVDCCQPVDDRR